MRSTWQCSSMERGLCSYAVVGDGSEEGLVLVMASLAVTKYHDQTKETLGRKNLFHCTLPGNSPFLRGFKAGTRVGQEPGTEA